MNLGKNKNYRDRDYAYSEVNGVDLSDEARKQGTYVIGTTGTGKTTLLLNMICQDMSYKGDWGYEGVCVLDPHGDFTDDILARVPKERVNDVILFDPRERERPFGLNLLECNHDDPRERDLVTSTLIDTLHKLFVDSWGPRMEDLLRNSILSLLLHDEPVTLVQLMAVLTNYNHRQRLTANAKSKDPMLRSFWEDQFPEIKFRFDGSRVKNVYNDRMRAELVESSLNKIGRFLTNEIIRNIVAQPKSTINFREAMDDGQIILVNLSKGDLGADNSSLLGSVIVNQILIAALSRRDLSEGERRPFHLYADEYQTFATKTFPELQSEARKYAIDTVVAHQYRDQLDELNRGSTLNVANIVSLRVSGKDAVEIAAQFNITPPEPDPEVRPLHARMDEEGEIVTQWQTPYGQRLSEVVPGDYRMYSDTQGEMANLLTQLPNHEALCRVLEPGKLGKPPKQLRQFRLAFRDKPKVNPSAAALIPHIRQKSLARAKMSREQVAKSIEDFFNKAQLPDERKFIIQP